MSTETPDFELAKGRVLHFNDHAWDRLQDLLATNRLHIMAEHVAEQRTKDVVVLDLDGIAPEAIVKALRDKDAGTNGTGWARVADQIEAQSKPPRIPEPAWGQKVTALASGEEKSGRRYFVRWWNTSYNAWADVEGNTYRWDDLIDPVLIRDGIEDGAS